MKKLPTFNSGNSNSSNEQTPANTGSKPHNYTPAPQHATGIKSSVQSSGSKTKKWGSIAVAVFVIGKLLLKIGLGFGIGYGVTSAEVEASKNEAWSKEFKSSFVQGCISSDNTKPVQLFCGCIADGIEKAHILPTKYNSTTETEAQYTEKITQLMQEYIGTEAGVAMNNGCLKMAGLQPTAPNNNAHSVQPTEAQMGTAEESSTTE